MIGRKAATRSGRVVRYRGSEARSARDSLAVEEPLEIRIGWSDGGRVRADAVAVTMRTPGDDFHLAAGFLHGEGLLATRDDVAEITYCTGPDEQAYNVVEVRLAPGRSVDLEALRRNVYTTSSCGVCGKVSLDAVGAIGCEVLPGGTEVDSGWVIRLPDRLREGQSVFARTGGLHATGLFEAGGDVRFLKEDVGRHNAMDKVVGEALLRNDLPASQGVLVVSGRASFELVQKAVAAGVPILVAVGAPSSLAVDLARRFGQTLVGFARHGGFNVYAGRERIR